MIYRYGVQLFSILIVIDTNEKITIWMDLEITIDSNLKLLTTGKYISPNGFLLFLRLKIEARSSVNNMYLLVDWNFQRRVIIDFSGSEMDEKENIRPHVVFILHVTLKTLSKDNFKKN